MSPARKVGKKRPYKERVAKRVVSEKNPLPDSEQKLRKAATVAAQLDRRIDDLANRLARLENVVTWMRKKMNQYWPERTYCPFCRALVHSKAKACGQCGRSWEKPVSPRVGEPM